MSEDRAPNAVRGEFALALGGTTYQLRPTHEAQETVETALDRSLVSLSRDAFAGNLKLAQIAVIVCEFVRAWGRQTNDTLVSMVSVGGLKPLIHDAGVVTVMQALQLPLGMAITGGVTSTGEPKPEALPKETTETLRAEPPVGESVAA